MPLQDQRQRIDQINQEIVDDVSERMDAVEKILELKKDRELEIVDEDRERKVKEQFERLFSERDLPEDKGRELAEYLIELGTEYQEGNA
ncbi:MAG: chorismate mutase [Candidatus Nanohaloarchaea archaeon]